MRKNAKYLIFILVIIGLIFGLLMLLNSVNHKGEASKEALIKAYLTALTTNDSRATLELTPSDYESRAAIQKVIKKYGGNEFKNIKTKYLDSESSGIWYAIIDGLIIDKNGKSYQYTEQLTLRVGQAEPYTVVYDSNNKSIIHKQDRWYLLLGKQKQPFSLFSPPLPSLVPPLKIYPSIP